VRASTATVRVSPDCGSRSICPARRAMRIASLAASGAVIVSICPVTGFAASGCFGMRVALRSISCPAAPSTLRGQR